MKKADVHLGATYLVKVAGNLVPVKIDAEHDNGGWVGTSTKTGKSIRIKSPQRLRKRLDQPTQREKDTAEAVDAVENGNLAEGVQVPTGRRKVAKPDGDDGKQMSCLDAAAKVLAEAGEPMNALAMFDAMVAKGYWTSEKATPQNTIYAAIHTEIKKRGEQSRFRKAAERGKFEWNA